MIEHSVRRITYVEAVRRPAWHTVVLVDDRTVDPARHEILAGAGADVEILDETIASERVPSVVRVADHRRSGRA